MPAMEKFESHDRITRIEQGKIDRKDMVQFFIINALAEATGLKQFSYLLKAAQQAGDDHLADVGQSIVRDEAELKSGQEQLRLAQREVDELGNKLQGKIAAIDKIARG